MHATTPLPPPPVKPFKYNRRLHSGCCQLLKMILVGLVLFPLRVLVFIFAFFGLYLSARFRICCKDIEEVKHYPLQGAVSRFFMRFFGRIILWTLGYWWVSVERLSSCTAQSPSSGHEPTNSGDGGSDDKAPIIVANHCSFADAFYFLYADGPMPVAKADLLKVPLFGTIALASQTLPVQRESATARHAVADEIARRTRWAIDQPKDVVDKWGLWPQLMIFPEATCTNTTAVIQFKLGAFAPLVPVQPVALDFRQDHLDVSWVGGAGVGMTILRMMCQVYNKLQVTYLPIVPPPDSGDAKVFAETVRRSIADALGVPTSEHNFLDVLLAHEVSILKLPHDAVNVGMGAYPDGLDMAKAALKQFAAADKNRQGYLDEEAFATVLGFTTPAERHEHATVISTAFAHWDRDDDGKINFQEFLLVAACVKVAQETVLRQRRAAVAASSSGTTSPAAGYAGVAPNTGSPSPQRSPTASVHVPDSDDDDDSGGAGPAVSNIGRVETMTFEDAPQPEGPTTLGTRDEELRLGFALSFGAFDTDHDGIVRRQEFLDAIAALAPMVNQKEVAALFDTIDEAKSGSVTMEQYVAFADARPVLVASLLDAIAATTQSAAGLSSVSPSEMGERDISRTNSFLGSAEE